MIIEAKTKDIIGQVADAKEKFEAGYVEAYERYRGALKSYGNYLVNQSNVSGHHVHLDKYQPSAPINYTESFQETLDFLGNHVGKTIELTEEEYKRVITQVKSWGVSISGCVASYLPYTIGTFCS